MADQKEIDKLSAELSKNIQNRTSSALQYIRIRRKATSSDLERFDTVVSKLVASLVMPSLTFCFASELFVPVKWLTPFFGHQVSFVKIIDLSKFVRQDTTIIKLKIPLWHILTLQGLVASWELQE
jgi:hypothetical protein